MMNVTIEKYLSRRYYTCHKFIDANIAHSCTLALLYIPNLYFLHISIETIPTLYSTYLTLIPHSAKTRRYR